MNLDQPPSSDPSPSWEIPPAEQKFLSGAERRMMRGMYVLGIAGVAICWLWRGWTWAAGFAIGAVLSGLNFHWMKSAVQAISDLAVSQSPAPNDQPAPSAKPKGVVIRFVLRYALIGVAAYAIFKSSFVSLRAFFLGLFLFLAGILVEIAYEIYVGLRKAS